MSARADCRTLLHHDLGDPTMHDTIRTWTFTRNGHTTTATTEDILMRLSQLGVPHWEVGEVELALELGSDTTLANRLLGHRGWHVTQVTL